MSELVWDQPGDIFYEEGISKGVLNVGESVVPWNGLVNVRESVDGGELIESYLDGVKSNQDRTSEEFVATLEAFMYPLEFEPCDGNAPSKNGLYISAQERTPFNLCYRTEVVGDVEENSSYNLNFIYNATATPNPVPRKTVSRDVDTVLFKWKLHTVPEEVLGFKPVSFLQINSASLNPFAIVELEEMLFGTTTSDPYFPTLDELVEFVKSYLALRVEVEGGTWTASSRFSEVVEELPDRMFKINYDTVIDHGDGTFTMSNG